MRSLSSVLDKIMTQYRYLNVSFLADGVVGVELARPPANAVCREMYIEIRQLFVNVGDVPFIVEG